MFIFSCEGVDEAGNMVQPNGTECLDLRRSFLNVPTSALLLRH